MNIIIHIISYNMNVFPIIFKIDVENPLFPYHAFSTSFCMSTPQVPPILRDDRRVFFLSAQVSCGATPYEVPNHGQNMAK